MRELRFRAWDWDDNEMYYPSVFSQTKKDVVNFKPLRLCKDWNRAYKWHHCMQYIWLEDKNKQEIYEWDIIKEVNHDHYKWFWVIDFTWWEIVFYKWWFHIKINYKWKDIFNCVHSQWNWENIEVIWNIYENPELLK